MGKAKHFLHLFRVFLPSWKFFDEVGAAPELSYRLEGSWEPALTRPENKLGNLFLHPEGNLFHACQSLVQRLIVDLAELSPDEIEDSVSYRLVENLVRFKIRQQDPAFAGRDFQFKISISQPEITDVLISKSHEV